MSTITNVQGFLTDNKKDALIPVRVDVETGDKITRLTMHEQNRNKHNQLDMTLSLPRDAIERSMPHEAE